MLAQVGIFELPLISETLDRLFAAMMTLRERISESGRDLLDNSFLPFLPQHVVEALVYSALSRAFSSPVRLPSGLPRKHSRKSAVRPSDGVQMTMAVAACLFVRAG
jgi:hypothetical protein